jgi:hypothetical protein
MVLVTGPGISDHTERESATPRRPPSPRIPEVSDPRENGEDDAHCTSRQHDTHSIDSREMWYPWHPWHGQSVWIRRHSARGGLPVFQCTLDTDSGRRLLEIPQWMFDASIVCLARFSSAPLASCEALRELKELIGPRDAVNAGEVIQAQHQSLSHTGGSDAKPSEVTPSKPTALVPSTDRDASLGESAARGSAPDPGTPRAAVTHPRNRRAGRPGGAR